MLSTARLAMEADILRLFEYCVSNWENLNKFLG